MADWWPMLHAPWPRTVSAGTLAAEGRPVPEPGRDQPTDLTDVPEVPADQPMLGVDAAAPADRRLSAGLGR